MSICRVADARQGARCNACRDQPLRRDGSTLGQVVRSRSPVEQCAWPCCFDRCAMTIDCRSGGDLPQGRSPLFLHVGVGREVFEREHVVGRKAQDPLRLDGSAQFGGRAQHLFQRFGCLVISHQYHNWSLCGTAKKGRKSARAVAVRPDTRLRPERRLRCLRTRSKVGECSRPASASRTKGRIMHL